MSLRKKKFLWRHSKYGAAKVFLSGLNFCGEAECWKFKEREGRKKKVQADSMCNEIDMYFHSCKQQMAPSLNPMQASQPYWK